MGTAACAVLWEQVDTLKQQFNGLKNLRLSFLLTAVELCRDQNEKSWFVRSEAHRSCTL